MRCIASAAILAGCAPALGEPPGAPVAEPGVLADSVRAATVPASPRQARFGWNLDERGTRLRGTGVARYEAPRRLRVDLFGPRGETYLAAALVGDSVRLPGALPAGLALPSPALLWGAVGVLRPPSGSTVTAAGREGERVTLRYASPAGETFQFVSDASGLLEVRRFGGAELLESVELRRGDGGTLSGAEYRNWEEFRSLAFEIQSAEDVAAFPDEIFSPGR